MYNYSKTTNSFYPVSMLEIYKNAGTLPNDLVDVEESVFIEFTQQPPEGKQRGADKKGFPAWVDLPPQEPPTQAQIEATARAYRDAFLTVTDKMTLIDYSIDDKHLTEIQRSELIQVRDSFKKWPATNDFPNVDNLPDMPLWLFNEAVKIGWHPPLEYLPSELFAFLEPLGFPES